MLWLHDAKNAIHVIIDILDSQKTTSMGHAKSHNHMLPKYVNVKKTYLKYFQKWLN